MLIDSIGKIKPDSLNLGLIVEKPYILLDITPKIKEYVHS